MSEFDNKLTVSVPDSTAEISIIDGNLNRVARSVGHFEQNSARESTRSRSRSGQASTSNWSRSIKTAICNSRRPKSPRRCRSKAAHAVTNTRARSR